VDGKPPDRSAFKTDISAKRVDISLRDVLTEKPFLYVLSAESLRMMVLTAVSVHVMPYLNSIGMKRSTAAFVTAGIPVFRVIGRFGFGWLGDVYDKRYVMALAFGLMGGVLILRIRPENGR
jgi:MFS family permease